jgi:HK97 family phage prohead protease
MRKKIFGEFDLRSLEAAEKDLNNSKSVYIEGFANKAVVDRGNDLIPPEAWKTEEFERNPIIFFNHDRNMPIGKAIKVQVTTEGLKIKVKISKSKAQPMPYIRDMIREKILRTFSVGFDPMDSEEKREDGVNVIRSANLLEVSVVSIPMNQESDFNLSKAQTKSWKVKSYDGVLADIFSQQGNVMLSKLHEILSNRQKNVDGFEKQEVLEAIAAKLGIDFVDVSEVLMGKGDITPEFLSAFANVLMVPKGLLKSEDEDEDAEEEDEDEDAEDEDEEEEMEDEEDEEEEEEEEEEKSYKEDETEFGNPHLTVAKSHLALAGAMVSKLEAMEEYLKDLTQLMSDLVLGKQAEEVDEGEGSDVMPADEDEAEEQAEESADDDMDEDDEKEMEDEDEDEKSEDEDEEKRLRLIRIKRKAKLIQDFKKRIGSI